MRGLETKEIASELKIGTDTVKKHIEKIMRKAGVDNRTALARWCLAI
jgi:DNA-binding NarL/FixJ family response regulator